VYETEYRVRPPNGPERWVAVHGQAVSPDNERRVAPVVFVGTLMDITHRRRAEDALREANARLAEADRRKDEFIAILSHELRNPLAPIRYALPLLERQGIGDSGARAVAVISRQVAHLTRLVDDFLDVSRMTSGKIALRMEDVTVDSILRTATEAASPAIVAGRHTLVRTVPDQPIWVNADPERIAQAITNLLNNSAKYTPSGGRISLEAERRDGHAVIRVGDNGIGFEPDAAPTLFEMFRQVSRADGPQGGLGIGLAFAKHLVELHGGSIEASSAGVGQGSEFVLHLPLAVDATTDHASAVATGATNRRLRVLVVDDNADFVQMLATVLECAGHDVRKALDGRGAIAVAQSYRPHVVLLDLGMPAMGGLEVARELRRHPELKSVRLVALTGWGQARDRQQTRDAGFDLHLTKPTDPQHLQDVIAQFASELVSQRKV
jgi:signal transduction histidine kinase/ActR/RegA family two-component response regulator